MFPNIFLIFTLYVVTKIGCDGQFLIPEVNFVAFSPKGFKASIPAINGIQQFAIHGNLNRDISQLEPGDFGGDSTGHVNNTWSYVNEDLVLKVGDVISYWIYIQYDKLGYRKDGLKWNVNELSKIGDNSCQMSSSIVPGKSFLCKNSVIFEDNFESGIDKNKWMVEEFIPSSGDDYEFVSYQNQPDVCYTKDNRLFIKPKPLKEEAQLRGELDLRDSCTRENVNQQCHYVQIGPFIIPPVTSGRLVSLQKFRYGKVEIRAKLPAGDWIYPQIYLEQVTQPNNKIWIAYARGNDILIGNNNNDIGSRLLFGGPITHSEEPLRSTYLKTKRDETPFTSQLHTYSVIWSQNEIVLQVDGSEYGKINYSIMKNIKFSENDMVRLVLGVGVGGINDFPDSFKSGNEVKPWRTKDRTQMKNFFIARNKWGQTWIGENSALQVEFVKITAL